MVFFVKYYKIINAVITNVTIYVMNLFIIFYVSS